MLADMSSIDDFDAATLPDRFVIKPSNWCSARGVMLIRKIEGRLFDQMTSRFVSIDTIKAEQAEYQRAAIRKMGGFLTTASSLKNLLRLNRVPISFRSTTNSILSMVWWVSSFGLTGIQNQQNWRSTVTNSCQYKNPTCTLNPDFPVKLEDGMHRRPQWWVELLDTAQRVSLALRTPFISVDTYASKSGPVIGDLRQRLAGPTSGCGDFNLGTISISARYGNRPSRP